MLSGLASVEPVRSWRVTRGPRRLLLTRSRLKAYKEDYLRELRDSRRRLRYRLLKAIVSAGSQG